MDFYNFINSKAVREHLCKINWPIEPTAAAWLIWHWEGPIEEKLAGWKYIIDNTEDCKLKERLHCCEVQSLHEFLKKTIKVYKEHSDGFYDNRMGYCCYKLSTYYADFSHYDYDMVFQFSPISTTIHENVLEDLNDGNVLKFEITKQVYDSKAKETATFDPQFRMIGYDCSDEEWLNIYEVFMNQWFYFPLPFKTGDIVHVTSLPNYGPMVYEDSIYEFKCFREHTEDYYNGKGDETDMMIDVYRVTDDLEPFWDTFWPVTDFDFFDEEDAKAYVNGDYCGINSNLDRYKMILLLSVAIKERLGLEILLSGYNQLKYKSQKEYYTSEIFSKAEKLIERGTDEQARTSLPTDTDNQENDKTDPK